MMYVISHNHALRNVMAFILFALLLFFFGSATAMARPEMAGKNVAERFAAMDKDNNGQISREEFSAAHPEMKDAAFDAIDTDGNGFLDREEWATFTADHGKGEQAMPPAGMDEGQKQPHQLMISPRSGQ